jgi:hypothetical protein
VAVSIFFAAAYLIVPFTMKFSFGLFAHWKLTVLIAALFIAIWAAARHWHWTARISVQSVWIVCFVHFLMNDFAHLPHVGRFQSNIAAAQRSVAENPDDVDSRLDLSDRHADLAYYWLRHERWPDAVGPFNRAVEILDSLYKQGVSEEHRQQIQDRCNQWFPELIRTYDHLGRYDDAEELLKAFNPVDRGDWRHVAGLMRLHWRAKVVGGAANQAGFANYVEQYVRDKRPAADDAAGDDRTGRLVAWITRREEWQLIGPFPAGPAFAGLDTPFGPEQSAEPQQQYQHNGRLLQSKTVNAYPDEYVDLARFVSQSGFIVAYASTALESPAEQKVQLLIGSDDGCKVWLNGELISEARVNRSYRAGQDRAPVTLRKGANRLLIKVEQTGLPDWGFSCDVVDAEGWPAKLERYAVPK